jgi:Flp pilus assembly protein TadG
VGGARKYREDRGAAAVELALILPVLFLILFGIVQFGWLFHAWISMEGGVRQGARYMALHNDPAGAQSAAKADMPTLGTSVTVSVAVNGTGTCSGPGSTNNRVTITATYSSPLPTIIPIIPTTITRTGVMQCGG